MNAYTFLSDESLFTWLPFDIIVIIIITVVKLMSTWFVDSELSTCCMYKFSTKHVHKYLDLYCLILYWLKVKYFLSSITLGQWNDK